MNDPTLFDRPFDTAQGRPGKVRRDHPETARMAAEAVEPRTGTLRRQVLDALREAGSRGLTDEQMQITLGMNPSTQRPRRVELVEAGWVSDSGLRRKTASGMPAIVWTAERT